jgi:hypothetical protein
MPNGSACFRDRAGVGVDMRKLIVRRDLLERAGDRWDTPEAHLVDALDYPMSTELLVVVIGTDPAHGTVFEAEAGTGAMYTGDPQEYERLRTLKGCEVWLVEKTLVDKLDGS